MSVIKRLLRSVRWKALNKNCGVTMYISRKDAGELIFQHRQDAIADVRGEADFLLALLDGDDWSLVIKSHALIESLVTELIVSKIDQPTMKSFIERLPLSDNEIGKIRIAKDYGILSAGQRSFLKNFSELRNRLVHRVENINFKFLEYVANLDKNQKNRGRKPIHGLSGRAMKVRSRCGVLPPLTTRDGQYLCQSSCSSFLIALAYLNLMA
ncbi:hypothetical protein [Burkholderia glumae]|uniref:hypothetical protein n=1 Tax=Burkholderia glumae TaxID=337 RepID=UPI00215150CD|nr:hypothetical protein [Burkholderia glumae]